MTLRPLADTLLEVVDALRPPPDAGLVMTEAEVELPLELGTVVHRGTLHVVGSAPHTRWRSGVLPPVHLSRIRVALLEEEPPPPSPDPAGPGRVE